jgi:hypothetical protein
MAHTVAVNSLTESTNQSIDLLVALLYLAPPHFSPNSGTLLMRAITVSTLTLVTPCFLYLFYISDLFLARLYPSRLLRHLSLLHLDFHRRLHLQFSEFLPHFRFAIRPLFPCLVNSLLALRNLGVTNLFVPHLHLER